MIAALREMLVDKKLLASLVGMILFASGHWGAGADPDKLVELLSPLMSYIFAQGVADHGKAVAAGKSDAPKGGTNPVVALVVAGSLIAAAHGGLSLATGCHGTPIPIADLEDCTKLNQDAIKTEGATLLAILLSQGIGPAESRAETDIVTIGGPIVGCAFTMMVDQYLKTTKHDNATGWAMKDAVEKFRAKVSTPGHSTTFRTKANDPSGDL